MLRRLAIILSSVAATLTAGEMLFRALPVSTATMVGYHVDPDIMTYLPGHAWTVSTGWDLRNPQRLRANNWGFASEIDFAPDARAVALVGDSFVESSMLDAAARPAAQLQDALGPARSVYGLGSPGTALLDHAQRIRLVSERFGVRDFIVWIGVGNALQTVCGTSNVHSRCLDPASLEPRTQRQPPPGALKRIARHSALLQYVFGQIKVDAQTVPRALWRREIPAEPAGKEPKRVDGEAKPAAAVAPQRDLDIVDAAIARFFADIEPYRQGRLIVVMGAVRGGSGTHERLRDRLLQGLRENRAEIVDLEPIFQQHRASSPLALEVGPYDAHLNALGVSLATRRVAAVLLGEVSASSTTGDTRDAAR